jgi:hypothetical protein
MNAPTAASGKAFRWAAATGTALCCQAVHARRWLEHQLRWLLPVPYYHVVFTLPHELHPLLLHNQQTLYKLLFDAAAQSLLDFARTRLEGTPGITAVLHTWGQKLNYHPHLHCILTAGALSEDATQWRRPKQQGEHKKVGA